ncbi:zinc-binding dehydrogenase [Rhodococcoides kyotonense]|uniref:Threonine dehydrogenase n=1 Tax=Rhodococcoides kyotonense TaxID=398843 RepID=A0A239LFL1_9NOCA|nr:zinc-binding dehydrogenase [Rhodococcus kyotonensis]SNT29437.1 Threonine dehydrogenase [Rhodococcus kyotonensis]
MTATTLAAVTVGYGEPIELREVPLPDELEPGALLVEMLASSICGTDVHGWKGHLTIPAALPSIQGHEMVGRITGFGDGPQTDSFGEPLEIGDRVIWSHASCGHCPACMTRRDSALCENPRMYGYANVDAYPYVLGGFSTHAYVLPNSGRVKVPDAVPDELASVAACAVRSAANAVEKLGAVAPGACILVQGAGPVGLFATAMLSLTPARHLIVVGGPDSRLEMAREFGATSVVSIDEFPTTEARRDEILRITGGVRPDLLVEMSGGPTAFAEGLDIAAKGARYVLMGQVSATESSVVASRITMKNLEVVGAFSGSIAYYKQALDFLALTGERFGFDRMISGRFALADINDAIAGMIDMTQTKPVIRFH